jgi:hypothetical protein
MGILEYLTPITGFENSLPVPGEVSTFVKIAQNL